eukprot:6201339-Pleurochrysis_carterae.AAC.1
MTVCTESGQLVQALRVHTCVGVRAPVCACVRACMGTCGRAGVCICAYASVRALMRAINAFRCVYVSASVYARAYACYVHAAYACIVSNFRLAHA